MKLDFYRYMLQIAGALLAFGIAMALTSCATPKVVTVEKVAHDTVTVDRWRVDSTYIYEKDSIFTDRYRAHDTIFLTTEKWSIRYRDREVLVHDSVYIHQVDSVPYPVKYEVEKPIRDGRFTFYCTVTWIVIVLLVIALAWFIFGKTPYGKMASTAIKVWMKL